MHPRFGVEREYAVRSLGVLDEEQRNRLLEGVEIDGQRAGFKSIPPAVARGPPLVPRRHHRRAQPRGAKLFRPWATPSVASSASGTAAWCAARPQARCLGDLPPDDVRRCAS